MVYFNVLPRRDFDEYAQFAANFGTRFHRHSYDDDDSSSDDDNDDDDEDDADEDDESSPDEHEDEDDDDNEDDDDDEDDNEDPHGRTFLSAEYITDSGSETMDEVDLPESTI